MNIYEIAKIVGYSPSVVARALSGKGYCSEEKKKKVIDIATEMGYRPSIAAKTMRNNFTYRVLMCIPDLYNSFYFRMIDGVGDLQSIITILCCFIRKAVRIRK
ncbi:MAG: LacI family DNA-binding transcriptional regulator [Clostridia bacterium]